MNGLDAINHDTNLAADNRDQLIQKLTITNERLEQFTYAASHDLREPLRIVLSFAELLQRECHDCLSDDGRQYMVFIRDAAKKMETIIADLEDYTYLSQIGSTFRLVDCNKKLWQAMEVLSEPIGQSRAVIQSDSLPQVMANPTRFYRLLQNLLGNAIKYRRPGIPPVIHVSAEDKSECWQFAVADNGIGIPPDYHDTIFLPFKRLHGQAVYAGTGLGLSICKHIVESFGGRIWVEGGAGSGSIFYFTIPKRGEG